MSHQVITHHHHHPKTLQSIVDSSFQNNQPPFFPLSGHHMPVQALRSIAYLGFQHDPPRFLPVSGYCMATYSHFLLILFNVISPSIQWSSSFPCSFPIMYHPSNFSAINFAYEVDYRCHHFLTTFHISQEIHIEM